MSDKQQEAIASLKLLACLAKADGKQHSEEKKILTQAWQKIQTLVTLPEDLTLATILAEDIQIDEILPNIVTRKTQILLHEAAYAIAEIDGITPREKIILDKIETSFKLPKRDSLADNNSLVDNIQSPDDLIEAIASQIVSLKEVRDLILDYAIGISILGFNPFPSINLVTNTIACGLIWKMIRDIGAKYGYPQGQDAIAIIGCIFGGFGALAAALASWTTLSFVSLFVPVIGKFTTTSFLFTLTWAVGQTTNQYYLSSRQLNATALKQAFLRAQQEGKVLSKKINLNRQKNS